MRLKSFFYQAGSGTQSRRVVAQLEHHVGGLFPRVGFIVTNLRLPSRAVVRFYNGRGTAEQWIKEGKRYYWFLLAESHLTRRWFGAMLRRIWALPVPTG